MLKYGITVVISFAAIVVLYEFLVSRVGIFRFLFEMKKKAVAMVNVKVGGEGGLGGA